MFVVVEAHLSETKRVVLCDARSETKRGMPGQPKLPRQARVLLGKQGKPKDAKDKKHPSKCQWGTNMKKTHYN
jgi:hypothetical protein